jgi:hypothetical protein
MLLKYTINREEREEKKRRVRKEGKPFVCLADTFAPFAVKKL